MGLGLFSRLAYVFRRELYFIFPQPWADTSGCLKYIGNDLRKYCAVCRSLRVIMDQLGVTPAIRGSVLLESLNNDDPDEELTAALNRKPLLSVEVESSRTNNSHRRRISMVSRPLVAASSRCVTGATHVESSATALSNA